MRKLFWALLGMFTVAFLVIYGWCADPFAPPGSVIDITGKPENTYTLLTTNTEGYTSSSKNVGFTASQHTIYVAVGGTAPTNVSTQIYGSVDGTNFVLLNSNTSTATSDMWHIANKPVRYIKGKFASKSGGDGTTVVSMTVTSGGN